MRESRVCSHQPGGGDVSSASLQYGRGSHQATSDAANSFVVRAWPLLETKGKALAEYAAERGWENIVTLGFNYASAHDTVDVFTQELNKLRPDARVGPSLWLHIGETDFHPVISEALAYNPDLILADIPGFGTINLIKQLNAHGFSDKTELLVSLPTKTLMALDSVRLEGVHGWSPAPFHVLRTGIASGFVASFRHTYDGHYPDDWAIAGYDLLYIIANTLERAGSVEPPGIRDAFRSSQFHTLRGNFHQVGEDKNLLDAQVYFGKVRSPSALPFPILSDVIAFPSAPAFSGFDPDRTRTYEGPCTPYCICETPECTGCPESCSHCRQCQ